METFWHEQRIERLTYLMFLGWSYAQIAADIGTTRSAISGKVDRLGLSKPVMSEAQKEAARKAAAARNLNNRRISRGTKVIKIREPDMEREPVNPPPPFVGSLNIPFVELRDFKNNEPNQCRFIADEPPGPDYRACGNETVAGESYCAHCRELTRSKSTLSQSERAQIIRIGTRNYLNSMRKAAA